MSPDRPCRWVMLAVLGAARLGASLIPEAAPLATDISEPVAVPAEVANHSMFVSVMINGLGPFRMQVDTGCSFSMISPEVAAAVQARGMDMEGDDVEALNGMGGLLSIPRVVLDSVIVAAVRFEGVPAGVVPLELQSKIDSRTLDGLLGYTLFSDLYFALDFPDQTLLLSDTWPGNMPPVRAELAITEQAEVPFITAKLEGREIELLLDTGANDRLHLPSDMAAGLRWRYGPRPGYLLAVAGGSGRARIGRLEGALELGPLRVDGPVADVSDGPASIGVGILHSFCVVFHENEDRLWLCSADAGPLPSPPERSVGLSILAEPGGWRVVSTIPGSPAEAAGIKPDDLVLSIEGRPAREWTRDRIQGWINAHPALALTLASPAGARPVTLPVWLLVP